VLGKVKVVVACLLDLIMAVLLIVAVLEAWVGTPSDGSN
jgi:hypothetical protein